MKRLSVLELKEMAKQIRRDLMLMLSEAGSGHSGGPLSMVEIATVLYFYKMKYDPKNSNWEERDYFFLSKGHSCSALYATLAEAGYFPKEWLMTLRKFGTRLQGHPHRLDIPGIEASCGSLGQGLSLSIGDALGLRLDGKPNRVYCLMSDGEQQEGQIWEAVMCAGHYKLDNLTGIIDNNKLQIDGHDIPQIINALEEAEKVKGMPTVIIADTIKGKGVSFMENLQQRKRQKEHSKNYNENTTVCTSYFRNFS